MSEDMLRKLVDSLEIQNLKARYCIAADAVISDPAGSTATFQTLFTPDVTADYAITLCYGRDALVGFLVDAIASNLDWLLHGIQTPRIEIDGDRATGHWVIMVQTKQKHLSGKEMLVGRYTDEFVRTPEGWRISAVRFAEEGIYPQIDSTSQLGGEPIILR
jgi:SnoaL-like protein